MRGYGEVVQVGVSEARRPEFFVWRGCRYQVRTVLDRWQERVPWWRFPALEEAPTGLERSVWRVEGAPGMRQEAGVFDLAQWRDAWTLERVSD